MHDVTRGRSRPEGRLKEDEVWYNFKPKLYLACDTLELVHSVSQLKYDLASAAISRQLKRGTKPC